MKDDPVNPFDHQTLEQKQQHDADEKAADYQCLTRVTSAVTSVKSVAVFQASLKLVKEDTAA